MQEPIVSIIIPCYNQAQFLAEAIESVLAQTYQNWECLIINDGSPDDTEERTYKFLKLYNRIKYFKKENGGVADARNYGIQKASARYILPLDADDKIGSDYLRLLIEEIEKDKDVKVIYCEAELFGDETGKWDLPEFSLKILSIVNMIFCTALFRREDWERVGGYDTNMRHGIEDWEFWINLLKNGGNVKKLPYLGFFYRKKAISRDNSLTNEQKKILEDYMVRKHPYFFLEHIGNPIHLNRELKLYKDSLNYISNKLPYRIYKQLKSLLKV